KVGSVQAVIPVNDIGPLLVVISTGQPEERITAVTGNKGREHGAEKGKNPSRVDSVGTDLSRDTIKKMPGDTSCPPTRQGWEAAGEGSHRGVQTDRAIPELIKIDEAGLKSITKWQQARCAKAKLTILERFGRVVMGANNVEDPEAPGHVG